MSDTTKMRLAILGTDKPLLELVEAAHAAGHTLVWAGDIRPEHHERVATLCDQLESGDEWESLLDHQLADAVLIGRGSATEEVYFDRLKRLVTGNIAVLVTQPHSNSVLPFYEIDMLRRSQQSVVQHFNPALLSTAWSDYANEPETPTAQPSTELEVSNGHKRLDHQTVLEREINTLSQVAIQRALPSTTREAVYAELAQDAEILRQLVGPLETVSAMGVQPNTDDFSTLQVQMTSSCGIAASWKLAPADAAPWKEIILDRPAGRVTLRMEDADGRLEPIESTDNQSSNANAAQLAIQNLASAIARNSGNENDNETSNGNESSWASATKAMELVDSVDLSLEKGRTIPIRTQELTEKMAFRGTMAAAGCGILMLIFMLVVVVAVLGVFKFPLLDYWPAIVLTGLIGFLALQFLPVITGVDD